MIIPIRCWSCGKPIGHLWEKFQTMSKEVKGNDVKEVLDELGVERYCCRNMLIGHVDLIDSVMKYRKA